MSLDSDDGPQLIKGDVAPGSIRRVMGKRGSHDELIELALVGHSHRYRVPVEWAVAHRGWWSCIRCPTTPPHSRG